MKTIDETQKVMAELAPQDTSIMILVSTVATALVVMGTIMLLFVRTTPAAAPGG